jgi:hypothetical protein
MRSRITRVTIFWRMKRIGPEATHGGLAAELCVIWVTTNEPIRQLSPGVRNHRNDVRPPSESVPALRRIPQQLRCDRDEKRARTGRSDVTPSQRRLRPTAKRQDRAAVQKGQSPPRSPWFTPTRRGGRPQCECRLSPASRFPDWALRLWYAQPAASRIGQVA